MGWAQAKAPTPPRLCAKGNGEAGAKCGRDGKICRCCKSVHVRKIGCCTICENHKRHLTAAAVKPYRASSPRALRSFAMAVDCKKVWWEDTGIDTDEDYVDKLTRVENIQRWIQGYMDYGCE